MNVLFFLTPKSEVAYIYDDYTMRQTLEKMEYHRYSSIPIINKKGECITIGNINLDTVVKGGLYYISRSCTNLPFNCLGGYMCVLYHDLASNDYVTQILISWNGKKIYYRNKVDDKWLNWKIISSTTVADVEETSIEFDETALGLIILNNRSKYKVINGICYVTIEFSVKGPSDNKTYGYTKINTNTIPKIGFSTKPVLNEVETNSSISLVLDKGDTFLKLNGTIVKREGDCVIQGSFSYPVVE